MRSEARKVHDLFFDILKIVFPDIDFREARNSLSSVYGSSKQVVVGGQNKRNKAMNGAEQESGRPQKPQTRAPIHEDTSRSRGQTSQKDLRVVGSGRGGGGGEVNQQEDSRPFTHPGELVICKKKRKDREKMGLKSGNNGSAGPVSLSPTTTSTITTATASASATASRGMRSPVPGSMNKDVKLGQQQAWHNPSPQQANGGGGGSVGWANPVKRMRTDAGKRRPSHL